MIRIGKPYIETHDGRSCLKALVFNKITGNQSECCFSTDEQYGGFFCDEVSDAFVVGLLLPALLFGQDIVTEGAVSERLFYNLMNSVIFTLSKAFNRDEIVIDPKTTVNMSYSSTAVGTGCSLGIDSFSSIIKHTSENCLPSYKLTHITYFNVGSHGENTTGRAKVAYNRDLEIVRQFSNEIMLPLVPIESNLPEFYKDLNLDFNQTGLIRNMSVVLAMQKLFKKYIYSSGYPVSEVGLSQKDLAKMEAMLLPALSTESTELITGDPDLSRTAKAKLICDNVLVRTNLYVCCSDLVQNNKMISGPWANATKGGKRNCSKCDKCLRTLLILDILKMTDLYKEVFDIPNKFILQTLFMSKVLGLKHKSYVFRDLYDFATSEKYAITITSRVLSLIYRFRVIDLFYKLADLMQRKNKTT